MFINERIADSSNYRAIDGEREIEYIVIHFTANDGDSAEGNANYFRDNYVGASAHYFVDEDEIWQSVADNDRAWHCGDTEYKHPYARNANSLGIELCSRRNAAGEFYFLKETVANAVELTMALMDQYGIPAENVIRHYDVTGKICPAPFVAAGYNDNTGGFYEVGGEDDAWQEFKDALVNDTEETEDNEESEAEEMRYKTVDDLPEWARATIVKLISQGYLNGNGDSLDLSTDMVRLLVILNRAGNFGE